MTDVQWLVGAIGVALLVLPAWRSIHCLIRARQLLRWRRPSIEGLDGQRVTLCGKVRLIKPPLQIQAVGECLWHRRVAKMPVIQSKGSTVMKTESDVSNKAKFSIVIDGRDVFVADLPTHVYGAHYMRAHNGGRIFHSYWLPVVDQLTVLGRLRQKGSRSEFVRDSKVGLIYSTHAAEVTAIRELAKAGLGLGVVGAGLAVLYYILSGIR